MEKNKEQNFLYGAAILSVATFVVKILGSIYKIPVQNMLGPVASGYFQAAYDVFSTVYVLATAGLPVAVSKLVSEAGSNRNHREKILRVALSAFFVIGLIAFIILFFGANAITKGSGNSESALSIRIVAPSMVFVCITGACRGFYQGQSNMKPTAVSQTVEALVKTVIGVSVTFIALKFKASDSGMAAAAMSGVTASCFAAAAFMLIQYLRQRSEHLSDHQERAPDSKTIFKKLVLVAIPITLTSALLTLSSLIDTGTIKSRLTQAGEMTSQMADFTYGAFTWARTLFNLAPAFVVPIGISVVPIISGALSRRDYSDVRKNISQGLRLTSVIAFPAALALFSLARPLLELLYSNQAAIDIAVPLLQVFGFAAAFICLVTVSNFMLQAMDLAFVSVITMTLGAICKTVLSLVLVGNPKIGIIGAPIGTLVCYIVICIPNLFFVMKAVKATPILFGGFVAPLIASTIMAICGWGSYKLLVILFLDTPAALMSFVVAGVTYVAAAILLGAIAKQDLLLLPKGRQIAKFLKIH